MNINLASTNPPESAQDRIEEHAMVMRVAGFPVTGQAALVSENQEELPGSYQVWLCIIRDGIGETWVWVDEEGRVIESLNPTDGFEVPPHG